MVILGLIDSKPSTAAILIDGKIVSATSEERLNRKKMANGVPRMAINQVIADSGLSAKDIDSVAIAQNTLAFIPEPTSWDGWFEDDAEPNHTYLNMISSKLAPIFGNSPLSWRAHHKIKRLLLNERVKKLPQMLKNLYGIHAPVKFFDHHYCHATSAYYTSNFADSLIITMDGGGDGRSGSVYKGKDGKIQPFASVDSFNSLGNFYSYVTALCGFKAELHEGKVTGLAALGEPVYANFIRKFIRYQEPGQIRYLIPMYRESAISRLSEGLPKDFKKADLAASVQLILEEIGTTFIKHWLRKTGERNIAVAGGVFANVKFNQRIHELDEVDNFFVHPAMDDSGLAVGAAYAEYLHQPGAEPSKLIQKLPDVYLGPEFSDREIKQAIQNTDYPVQYDPEIHTTIAKLLSQGYVVARFTGRMEYGPRALGHRSILYQTTDATVNEWLNDHLKRTEFMPFAPATLVEHAHLCYEGIQGADDPARFMTITFNCTAEMKATSPGVVHVDGTARPQIIDPDTAPDFNKILIAYHQITGIPSLINTSYNMHGEPIVCSPQDALRSFQQGNLDYLAIGNYLVANPELINNGMQKAAMRLPE
jgi:carbamoyltransferase